MKTVMVGPGAYTVCEGRLSVQIIRNYELQGPDKWIAYASWDPYLCTDPGPTKRWAVGQAQAMIRERLAIAPNRGTDAK